MQLLSRNLQLNHLHPMVCCFGVVFPQGFVALWQVLLQGRADFWSCML